MKVRDLIDELVNLNQEAEVRLALQPSHPLQSEIKNRIVEVTETGAEYVKLLEDCEALEEEIEELDAAGKLYPGKQDELLKMSDRLVALEGDEQPTVVYIAQGPDCDSPYLPYDASADLGWA